MAHTDLLVYVGMMLGAHAAMPDEERQQLAVWERQNLGRDSNLATSDWPGWSRYLPARPAATARATFQKRKIPQRLRTQVLERDTYRCRRCGTHKDLAVDHIVPESKGGPTEPDNLQALCRTCNTRKGSRAS